MRRLWTEEEIVLLRKLYPFVGDKITVDEICELLRRSKDSIRTKASALGLKSAYEKGNINYEMLKQLEKRIEI